MNNAWAVVTGASSGLGVAFADRIASEGVGVVLVARREDKLREVAADLRRRRGVDTDVVAADLSTQEGVQKVIDAMEGRELAYLVNNAGFGTLGDFEQADESRIANELNLNVVALTQLSRAAAPGMVERGRGAIINVASTAAFQPIPRMAVYAASKAYVLRLTIALWSELHPTGEPLRSAPAPRRRSSSPTPETTPSWPTDGRPRRWSTPRSPRSSSTAPTSSTASATR